MTFADSRKVWLFVAVFSLALPTAVAIAEVPDDFPRYIVPGKEAEMESLRQLFWLHYQVAGPQIPLWDEWLPNATLWPAVGTGTELNSMRERWAKALSSRLIDAEGYVATQQHDGTAHAEGWPFPLWQQAGGVGWHFRSTGVAGYDAPLTMPDNWKLIGAISKGVNDRGWQVEITDVQAALEAPAFAINPRIAPWLRLNWWASGIEHAKCYVEWATKENPKFSPERRVYFEPVAVEQTAREARTMIRMDHLPEWKGIITKLRIGFENAAGGKLTVKSFHTACDTRHNVNNLNFIRGCHDYFLWTRDVAFLRDQIGRIRTAMRFVEREFHTRERKCIYTTWPGHEGRSGVRRENGQKQIVAGEGIGSNYWDLLPFGGEDALATVYYYDTLNKLAELEELIAAHADWNVSTEGAFDPNDLRTFATDVKSYFGKRFWNDATGRFGTVDLDGQLHDYGFTFLNCEAVTFGIVTPPQAKSIFTWLNGDRIVQDDTSTGPDIYHWRFAPRSTTRRNIDYYFWAWSNPEGIPFGYQVQDGGAVLGWTHYDLMTRINTSGADNAAKRLLEIANWFTDTHDEGGYRAYYAKDPSRGSLQGGNVPGGLGLDREFIESVLATQSMLCGFLGFRPTCEGFAINPRLPSDWPELTITRVHLHDHVLDITADSDGGLKIHGEGPKDQPIIVEAPANVRMESANGVKVKLVTPAAK